MGMVQTVAKTSRFNRNGTVNGMSSCLGLDVRGRKGLLTRSAILIIVEMQSVLSWNEGGDMQA